MERGDSREPDFRFGLADLYLDALCSKDSAELPVPRAADLYEVAADRAVADRAAAEYHGLRAVAKGPYPARQSDVAVANPDSVRSLFVDQNCWFEFVVGAAE